MGHPALFWQGSPSLQSNHGHPGEQGDASPAARDMLCRDPRDPRAYLGCEVPFSLVSTALAARRMRQLREHPVKIPALRQSPINFLE